MLYVSTWQILAIRRSDWSPSWPLGVGEADWTRAEVGQTGCWKDPVPSVFGCSWIRRLFSSSNRSTTWSGSCRRRSRSGGIRGRKFDEERLGGRFAKGWGGWEFPEKWLHPESKLISIRKGSTRSLRGWSSVWFADRFSRLQISSGPAAFLFQFVSGNLTMKI